MQRRMNLILLAVALGLALFAWAQGGVALAKAGLYQGARELVSVVPLLVAAFFVAGMIQALVTQELVSRWLGREAGWRGILLASLGGALIPGGPYVYYPIAAVLLRSGASLGVLVAFVTAKNVWSVSRLPIEFALLGSYLTLTRLAVTCFVPPLAGVLAEVLAGHRVEQIREAMQQ